MTYVCTYIYIYVHENVESRIGTEYVEGIHRTHMKVYLCVFVREMCTYRLVTIINIAASSLYPAYRFFTAWSESGEIDFSLIASSVKNMASSCLGPDLVASLTATCSCFAKAKDVADQAQGKFDEGKEAADQIKDNILDTPFVSMAEDAYEQAKNMKEGVVDEVQEMSGETKKISAMAKKRKFARNEGGGDAEEEDDEEEGEEEEDNGEKEIEEEEEEKESQFFGDLSSLAMSAGVMAAGAAAYVGCRSLAFLRTQDKTPKTLLPPAMQEIEEVQQTSEDSNTVSMERDLAHFVQYSTTPPLCTVTTGVQPHREDRLSPALSGALVYTQAHDPGAATATDSSPLPSQKKKSDRRVAI